MEKENANMPTKFTDIISKSVLIHPGNPAVYQLNAKQEICGTVKRKTIGEKDVNKINKTILLVGETGAGKSAVSNALLNYMMGVKFEDNVWFEIIKDEGRNQPESQTSDVIVYEIYGFEGQTLPYSLTIIDTPGYGDTRGKENDVFIREKLFDLFTSEDGVDTINAVGLVMKASDNRLSDRLIYIIDSVMSLFGKDLETSIVALVTHSDGRKPKTALNMFESLKIKCARNENNEPIHFLFNNCQHEDRTEERDYLEQANNITAKGLGRFTDFLDKTAPQKLKKSIKVLNERIRLAACVHNLLDRIKESELKRREVEQIQKALNKHKEDMEMNKDFTIEYDETYKEKVPIKCPRKWLIFFSIRPTCCTVCEENCHLSCKRSRSTESCKVMTKGTCTVCINKCPASKHVKDNWTYVNKTRKVQKSFDDVKKKYEQNKTESEKKSSLLKSIEKEMNKLTKEKSSLLEESYQHIVRLEQIALNVDSLSTHVHLDFLIENMKETGDTKKVQKLEEIRRRQDEGIRKAMAYLYMLNQLNDETVEK